MIDKRMVEYIEEVALNVMTRSDRTLGGHPNITGRSEKHPVVDLALHENQM